MASGHVNRINRPDTWPHRPSLQNVKKALANSEPSTHGTIRKCRRPQRKAAYGSKADSGRPSMGVLMSSRPSRLAPAASENAMRPGSNEHGLLRTSRGSLDYPIGIKIWE